MGKELFDEAVDEVIEKGMGLPLEEFAEYLRDVIESLQTHLEGARDDLRRNGAG